MRDIAEVARCRTATLQSITEHSSAGPTTPNNTSGKQPAANYDIPRLDFSPPSRTNTSQQLPQSDGNHKLRFARALGRTRPRILQTLSLSELPDKSSFGDCDQFIDVQCEDANLVWGRCHQ